MSTVKTNKINLAIDRKVFNDRYSIFRIDTSDKYFPDGYRMLDEAVLDSNVISVAMNVGNSFYVMGKAALSRRELLEAVRNSRGGDKCRIVDINPANVPEFILARLLFNGLARCEFIEDFRCSNLTGRLFLFSPEAVSEEKDQIKAIELNVGQNMQLSLSVRTFTSERKKRYIEFKKGKSFGSYPQFVVGAFNTLRRKLSSDKSLAYIQRKMRNAGKSEILFLNIRNDKEFSESKMGLLQKSLNLFNLAYKGIAEVSYRNLDLVSTEVLSKTDLKENRNRVISALMKYPPHLVDKVETEGSALLVEELKKLVFDEYGVDLTDSKRMRTGCLNLRLIHEKDRYDEGFDEYRATDEKYTIQNITYENFGGCVKSAYRTVFHELIIKEDIRDGRFTLYDWSSLNLDSTLTFGCEFPSENGEGRFIFMNIQPDGTFTFDEVDRGQLFYPERYEKAIQLFSLVEQSETVEGIIVDDSGRYGVFIDTGMFTIPEIDGIRRRLQDGDTYLRGKSAREELLSAVVDINVLREGETEYFNTGVIGAGMQVKVPHASHIRRIVDEEGKSISLSNIIPLLDVAFVRNQQMTVLPFPFKYIREFSALKMK